MSNTVAGIISLVLVAGILAGTWYVVQNLPVLLRGPLVIDALFVPIQTRTVGGVPPPPPLSTPQSVPQSSVVQTTSTVSDLGDTFIHSTTTDTATTSTP